MQRHSDNHIQARTRTKVRFHPGREVGEQRRNKRMDEEFAKRKERKGEIRTAEWCFRVRAETRREWGGGKEEGGPQKDCTAIGGKVSFVCKPACDSTAAVRHSRRTYTTDARLPREKNRKTLLKVRALSAQLCSLIPLSFTSSHPRSLCHRNKRSRCRRRRLGRAEFSRFSSSNTSPCRSSPYVYARYTCRFIEILHALQQLLRKSRRNSLRYALFRSNSRHSHARSRVVNAIVHFSAHKSRHPSENIPCNWKRFEIYRRNCSRPLWSLANIIPILAFMWHFHR